MLTAKNMQNDVRLLEKTRRNEGKGIKQRGDKETKTEKRANTERRGNEMTNKQVMRRRKPEE